MKNIFIVICTLFAFQSNAFTNKILNSSLNVSAVATDATCGVADGTITVTVIGGTAPFNYSIDGGGTYQSGNYFTGLPSGSYSIVVQDGLGEFGYTTTIIMDLPTTLTFMPLLFPPTCGMNDGNITIIPSGGSGSYTYSIDNGATFQALNGFTGLSQGVYNLVVNDGSTCQAYDTVNLISNVPHIDSVHVTPVVCNGDCNGSMQIFVSGGTGSIDYSIDGGPTFYSINYFTGLCSGNYYVIVRDALGCEVDTLILVNEPAVVAQVITSQNTNCGHENGIISIAATGGNGNYEYSVDGGLSYFSSFLFDSLISGNYTVITRDSLNCISPSNSVTIDTSLGITGVSVSTIENCNTSNAQIDISVVGGTSYLFSIDGGLTLQTDSLFTGLSEGVYAIYIADTNGCTSEFTDTVVNIGNGVNGIVSGSPLTICNSQTSVLSASGGTNYLWSTGSNISTIAVTPTVTTTYTVTISNALCNDIDTVTITVVDPPVTIVSASDTLVCPYDSVILSASGGDTYFWNNGETTSSIYVNPSSTTVYSCIASVSGCPDTTPDLVQITVYPAANANITASATAVVIGDSIVFSGLGTIGTSYFWQFGNGDTDTIPIVTYTYSSPGVYTVYLTTVLGDCYDTDTLEITISTAPGFTENTILKQFDLYPNPNEGNFNLKIEFESADDVAIRITNLLGENLYNSKYKDVQIINEKINLNNFSTGLFYLIVEQNNLHFIKKFEIIK